MARLSSGQKGNRIVPLRGRQRGWRDKIGTSVIDGGGVEYRNGAQGRNRTTDTAIFNRMLYQLSYLGAKLGPVGWASRARAL